VVKQIVGERGPDVYLSVIQAKLGCAKSTASRLRADAVREAATEAAAEPDAEPERGMEAS
jgi:hypothetical protein